MEDIKEVALPIRAIYVEGFAVDAKGIVKAIGEGDLTPEEAVEWIEKLVRHNVAELQKDAEPYCWALHNSDTITFSEEGAQKNREICFPLYTHPKPKAAEEPDADALHIVYEMGRADRPKAAMVPEQLRELIRQAQSHMLRTREADEVSVKLTQYLSAAPSLHSQSCEDGFRGDNAQLCASIEALLELDASGALVPQGVGGHARGLLSAAASRLRALPAQSEGEQK